MIPDPDTILLSDLFFTACTGICLLPLVHRLLNRFFQIAFHVPLRTDVAVTLAVSDQNLGVFQVG
jgi:hypothetical protein